MNARLVREQQKLVSSTIKSILGLWTDKTFSLNTAKADSFWVGISFNRFFPFADYEK